MHDLLDDALRTAGQDERHGAAADPPARGPIVAVPLFRTPELLRGLADALVAMAGELRALDASVLLIDDSPDDIPLRHALARALPRLAQCLRVELIRNPANLGFVRSANVALAKGRDAARDVLLLNSDTLPRPGAFAELAAVARTDPMIAVVSPRSDNATICNSPVADDLRRGDLDQRWAAHRRIEKLLPRVSYVPTAVGFCLYVRHAMLREFGLFDEVYGGGYNEENDFIRRCNRRGYRAVLANHAYVHHLGGVSFARSASPSADREEANRAILLERYPEYDAIVRRWFDGAEHRAEKLVSGLVPADDGRTRVLFDCRALKCFFNGTHEHIRALLTAFSARHAGRFEIGVLCDAAAFAFHGLDAVAGLARRDAAEARARPAALALRLGQPFEHGDLASLLDFGATTGVLMFDTIAMDCQQLDETGLETLWEVMLDGIDTIGFNSEFSRDQFQRRFAVPARAVQFVSRCSTDARDYVVSAPAAGGGSGILLIGNHFPHKHVRDTLAALKTADATIPVTVFGLAIEQDGVASFEAGEVPQDQVDALYEDAAVVLFPSHYEGFGLPILHALARRRPVIARDLPSAREIRRLSAAGINLHLAATTADMVALALDPPRWIEAEATALVPAGWAVAGDAVAAAIDATIARFDFVACRRRQAHAIGRRGSGDAAADPWDAAATDAETKGGYRLPDIGSGFMLADQLATAVGPHEVADDAPPLCVTLAADEPAGMAGALLAGVRDVPSGAMLAVTVTGAEPQAADDIRLRVLLLACGCQPLAITRIGDEMIVQGLVRADWEGLLPGPPKDADFVRYLYRQALGRNPDASGGRHYLDALQAGAARDDLLRVFLSSPERQALVAQQLKAFEKAPG